MLRTPIRLARRASCLAFSSPNLRMENCFFRVTPNSGLHVARQYFRHGLVNDSDDARFGIAPRPRDSKLAPSPTPTPIKFGIAPRPRDSKLLYELARH